jgi:hypothetical protein
LSGTGFGVRTGTDAWAQRSVATASSGRITVTNGDGVAGNPTLDLATVISATGPIGAAGTVPIVTVDAYGRVTALTSTAITGAALTLSDVTTNNVSTSMHGFFPKLDGTSTHFFDMSGSQRALAAADFGTTMDPQFAHVGLGVAVNTTYVLNATHATSAVMQITTAGATGTAGVRMCYNGTSQAFQFAARGDFGGFNITDQTASASRMFIKTDGTVGFGSTSPLGKVEARSTSVAQLVGSYDASNYLGITVGSSGTATFTGAGTAKGIDLTDGLVAGTGTGRAKPGGVLKSIVSTSANSGSSETDLHSITIPASTLAADGDTLRVTMGFSTAANANNKTLKLKFGSTTLLDTTALAANATDAIIEAVITRTGATTQIAMTRLKVKNGSAWLDTCIKATPAETLSGSITLKATGQGSATNEVVQNLSIIEYLPANP